MTLLPGKVVQKGSKKEQKCPHVAHKISNTVITPCVIDIGSSLTVILKQLVQKYHLKTTFVTDGPSQTIQDVLQLREMLWRFENRGY